MFMSMGNSLEMLRQLILVGIILVDRHVLSGRHRLDGLMPLSAQLERRKLGCCTLDGDVAVPGMQVLARMSH